MFLYEGTVNVIICKNVEDVGRGIYALIVT